MSDRDLREFSGSGPSQNVRNLGMASKRVGRMTGRPVFRFIIFMTTSGLLASTTLGDMLRRVNRVQAGSMLRERRFEL
jgi:hypothetical protein